MMKQYLRFSIVTFFFMVCVAYVVILSQPAKASGWSAKDKQDWLSNCIGGGIGTEELCNCIIDKLQMRFSSLEDMYKNPQLIASTMQAASSDCKD